MVVLVHRRPFIRMFYVVSYYQFKVTIGHSSSSGTATFNQFHLGWAELIDNNYINNRGNESISLLSFDNGNLGIHRPGL